MTRIWNYLACKESIFYLAIKNNKSAIFISEPAVETVMVVAGQRVYNSAIDVIQ